MISHKLRGYCSLTDVGIECSDIDGGDLTPDILLPDDTSERMGGHTLYLRLADDKRTIFPLFKMILRIQPIGHTGQTTRISAPSKLEWFARSKTVALSILQGPQGSRAFLLDASPQSSTCTQIMTTITLPALREPLDPDLLPLTEGQHSETSSREHSAA